MEKDEYTETDRTERTRSGRRIRLNFIFICGYLLSVLSLKRDSVDVCLFMTDLSRDRL